MDPGLCNSSLYNKSDGRDQIISALMKEARHSMDHEHFEDAVIKLHRSLQLEDEPRWRTGILHVLGFKYPIPLRYPPALHCRSNLRTFPDERYESE